MNLDKIQRALRDLSAEGIDVESLRAQVAAREALRESAVPTEDDTGWPLLTPCGIEEHLAGTERPTFGVRIAKGRMYTLTVAQRQILREWFNMIPSPEVEVIEIALYPGAVAFAREVVIKTTPHVAHGKVLNGPRVITLSRFGAFMSACCAREKELTQQAEVGALTKRIEKLLRVAKEKSVPHDIRSAGALAWPWHSQVEVKRITDPAQMREELRALLVSRGEPQLAALVREPSFARVDDGEKETEKVKEYNAFLSALGM